MIPYFRKIKIPDLDVMSGEILDNVDIIRKSDYRALTENSTFYDAHVRKLLECCPTLSAWLADHGIRQYLEFAMFPWIAAKSQSGLHLDFPASRAAINIPVLNCNNSFSSWHSSSTENPHNNLPFYSCVDTGIEYARIDSKFAHWFNSEIPHKGTNLSNEPRMIMTMRFSCNIDLDKFDTYED